MRAGSPARRRIDPVSMGGIVVLGIVVIAMLAVPLAGAIAGISATEVDLGNRLLPPLSGTHVLGTDQLGRDVLVRALSAGRLSLAIGLLVTTTEVLLGCVLGLVAGFLGGGTDAAITALSQVVATLPGFYLLVALSVLFGPSVPALVGLLAALSWVGTFRVVRAATAALRDAPYVEAAMAVGVSVPRLLWRHVLPNLASPLSVQVSLGVGGAILAESGLSFLGLGVQSPATSWGSMISEGLDTITTSPLIVLAPAILLIATVAAVQLIADLARDALDPRTGTVVRRSDVPWASDA